MIHNRGKFRNSRNCQTIKNVAKCLNKISENIRKPTYRHRMGRNTSASICPGKCVLQYNHIRTVPRSFVPVPFVPQLSYPVSVIRDTKSVGKSGTRIPRLSRDNRPSLSHAAQKISANLDSMCVSFFFEQAFRIGERETHIFCCWRRFHRDLRFLLNF